MNPAWRRTPTPLRELLLWLHLLAPVGLAFGLGRWLETALLRSARPGSLALIAAAGSLAYLADRWPRIGLSTRDNPARSALLAHRQVSLLVAALLALALATAALRAGGWPDWRSLVLLAPPTLAYPLLKKRFLLKNLVVPGVWSGALLGIGFPGGIRLLPTAGLFLLLAAGTLLCDLKDAEGDRTLGFGGTAARLGAPLALHVARILLAASGLLALAAPHWSMAARAGPGLCSLLLLLLSTRVRWLERELLGPVLVDWTLAGCGLAAMLLAS